MGVRLQPGSQRKRLNRAVTWQSVQSCNFLQCHLNGFTRAPHRTAGRCRLALTNERANQIEHITCRCARDPKLVWRAQILRKVVWNRNGAAMAVHFYHLSLDGRYCRQRSRPLLANRFVRSDRLREQQTFTTRMLPRIAVPDGRLRWWFLLCWIVAAATRRELVRGADSEWPRSPGDSQPEYR